MSKDIKLEDTLKDTNNISIDILLTLCEIPNYREFINDLDELISNNKIDVIYIINDLAHGKNIIGKKECKLFVEKYKNVFDVMKKHNVLNDMTIYEYCGDQKDKIYNCLFFNQFLLKNKDQIEKIKNNVLKLSSLGFSEIYFDENINFGNYNYYYDTYNANNVMILDNIDIVPTYSESYMKYSSNDSFYCMILPVTGYGIQKKLLKDENKIYGGKIILNDLLFDENILPNELNNENTINMLKRLSEEENKDKLLVQNSVDLVINSDDLMNQYLRTKAVFEAIDDADNKDEMNKTLHECLVAISNLKLVSLEYENSVIEHSDKINEDVLEDEKKLYLKRRKNINMHLD